MRKSIKSLLPSIEKPPGLEALPNFTDLRNNGAAK